MREEIDRTNSEIEKAEREYDLNKAAELKYGKLPSLRSELAAEEQKAEAEKKSSDNLLRDKVTEEEIARIVARWTGIPVAKLMEGESQKLLGLEGILHQRVIGQDEAVVEGNGSDPSFPCRYSGSEPPDRFLPLPWSHRRWQDRAGEGSGTGTVR